jgi:ribosomal protein L37AE/L43A
MLTALSVVAAGYPPRSPFQLGIGHAVGFDKPGARRDSAMSPQSSAPDGDKQWESVHLCPKCGHPLDLEEMDLEAVTTGIATCPKCDWASPINLKIVQIVQEDKPL